MEEEKNDFPSIVLDNKGYVYAGGLRIARFVETTNCLQFLDRDRRRSGERGSRFVEVPISDLVKIVKSE